MKGERAEPVAKQAGIRRYGAGPDASLQVAGTQMMAAS